MVQSLLAYFFLIFSLVGLIKTELRKLFVKSKREMIFVQPFCDNFLTTFSLILALLYYSLSSFFSLHCFRPMKREKKEIVTKVVPNDCSNIITQKKKFRKPLYQKKKKKIIKTQNTKKKKKVS